MPEHPRIEDLRRRIQRDPASIAFAQLAEELRRAGHVEEAVAVCRAGLRHHPDYLSARVTYGRALIDLHQLDEAQRELERVLKSAPDNLAALRGLADIHQRRGDAAEALTRYRAALVLAPHDPDLGETVAALSRQLSKQNGPAPADGLSFAQTAELLTTAAATLGAAPAAATVGPETPSDTGAVVPPAIPEAADHTSPKALVAPAIEHGRAERTIVALEHWLDAIHVARAARRA